MSFTIEAARFRRASRCCRRSTAAAHASLSGFDVVTIRSTAPGFKRAALAIALDPRRLWTCSSSAFGSAWAQTALIINSIGASRAVTLVDPVAFWRISVTYAIRRSGAL
jgi:hypothetical protein